MSCDSLCDKKIVFEIWSTGGFTDEAATRLITAHQRTKKYQVDFYDSDAMLKVAKEKNIRHFVEIVNLYYTKEL